MKKNLRNRLLALAAVSVSSIMLLSGFDSSMTVEDIMAKAQEANASLSQFSAHAVANGDIQLVVNTPLGKRSQSDDSYIRKNAIRLRIPYMTTLAAAFAALKGIEAIRGGLESVCSLQEYHR